MFNYRRAVGSLLLIGSSLTFSARIARAQDTVPPVARPSGEKTAAQRAEEFARSLFQKPLHLSVSSIAPGGGLTFGVGFAPKPWSGNRFFTSMRTGVSIRKFWIAEGGIGWQNDGYARIEVFGRVRDMPRLNYFGLGNDSVFENEASYLMTERTFGATGWIKPRGWLKLGTRLEHIGASLGAGRSPTHPSIETRFDDVTAPGLIEQTGFFHAQATVDVMHPSDFDPYVTNSDYRVSYGIFRGNTSVESQSFDRVEFEARQLIPLPKPSRRITLRLWGSSTRPTTGSRVPFYMMQTLGGSGMLRGYQDPMVGGDETQATLRGFSSYRFRDLNLLLLQAEYRIKLHGPIDLSLFTDAGQAAPRWADLSLRDLHHDYGFAISVMQQHKTAARVDFGFGGGQGIHVALSFGKIATR